MKSNCSQHAFRSATSAMRLLAVGAAVVTSSGAAFAQSVPTTSTLGSYTICRTSIAGQACHELSLTTAARFDSAGTRNGTTGTMMLRNLQGTVYTAPNGSSFLTGSAASVLTGVTFYTQGCLPGQPCLSPDFFDGIAFGSTQSGATNATALGAIAGSAPNWTWQSDKPLAADNPNTLRFVANTRFVNNFVRVQVLGIGGCTGGGGQLDGQFRDVVQEARTCTPQGLSGALAMTFATAAVFNPTYITSLRVDWAQQTTPGAGDFASYFCAASSVRRGEALTQSSGGCSAFASVVAVVPEPGTWALFAAGLVGIALTVARQRTASIA